MLRTIIFHTLLTAAATLAVAGGASAQSAPQGLPTAPGADKTVTEPNVPPSGAKASLPGENGSPLEPWLVTWLLPVSGLLAVGVAGATDRRVRQSGAGTRQRRVF